MADLHPLLRIGTSSWSNAEWPLYPKGMKPGGFLSCYAGRFRTVEVDSSFYRAPAPGLCERWYGAVPEGFTFALKVPQSITHEKALESADGEWEGFLASAGRLKEKLGYLVLQFPYFNKSSACPTLGEFLRRLSAFLEAARAPCPLVVEVRNKSWVGKDLLVSLKERNAIFAVTDQEWMPRPGELWEKYGPELLTGPAAYLRMLGERKRIEAITTSWEKLVIDRTQETRDAIAVIRSILATTRPVVVMVNNHYAGYAVASIELFESLWIEA